MEINWEEELRKYEAMWSHRRSGAASHTREVWDSRADEWERELTQDRSHRKRTDRRVEATIRYLSGKGLLTAEQDVIDVGCGPGRFVGQFAKTARRVVGTDLSPRMLEYGERYARELGVKNTSFVAADFGKADIDALNWRGRFDLVFSSITPAIRGMEGLERMMRISRGYCFNSCFVHAQDVLLDDIRRDVFRLPSRGEAAGHSQSFYALANLLWLRGYYPECTYYTEETAREFESAAQAAGFYAPALRQETGSGDAEERIRAYLQEKYPVGQPVPRQGVTKYGWILWNVNERRKSAGGDHTCMR